MLSSLNMDHVSALRSAPYYLLAFFPFTGVSASATKIGAVVGGQTSVKAPERAAFEKYLPADVDIVSCHSLHGPTVSPEGEPLVSHGSTRVNETSLTLP